MQIVIDIPDEQIEKSLAESKYIHEGEGEKGSVHIVLLYTNKKLEFVDISRKTDFYSLTDKYTVLPKGHGRLIDISEYEKYFNTEITYDDGNHIHSVYTSMISTILDADKESN